MAQEDTPILDALGSLVWFTDLSDEHRLELLAEISILMQAQSHRAEFVSHLTAWAQIAHRDAKQRRFNALRQAGVL